MDKSCILISSYNKHQVFLEKCLYTMQKCTQNNLKIYIVIGKNDIKYFSQYENKFANVKIIIASRIIKLLENVDIDEDDVLSECGKYNYQSLKKFYGLYYLFNYGYDNVIIFDSETVFVRNIDIYNLIYEYVNNPFLVCSKNRIENNKLHLDVDDSTRSILNIPEYNGWFLEYYLWIYERRIFSDLLKYLLFVYNKRMLEIVRSFRRIFTENLFQEFIYINNEKYHYTIINFDEYITKTYPNNYEIIFQNINKILPLRPIEDCRELVEIDMGDIVKDMYTINNFVIYKTNNTEKSLNFINDVQQIKICASEFSEKVFEYFYPNYLNDVKFNHSFVQRNTTLVVVDGNDIYNIVKKTNKQEKLLWIGYEIIYPRRSVVKFSVEMLFNKMINIAKNNFIAFKRHDPYELQMIQLNNIIVGEWKTYTFTFKIDNEKSDLYIMIFDDAPECDVSIRNFIFNVEKK